MTWVLGGLVLYLAAFMTGFMWGAILSCDCEEGKKK